jgi:homocysteine S-methyltransferase
VSAKEDPSPRILDGAFGTYVQARGFAIEAPLWSARALFDDPALVGATHREYLEAGAQVIRAASFGLRAHLTSSANASQDSMRSALHGCNLAARLAREAVRATDLAAEVFGTIAAQRDLQAHQRRDEYIYLIHALCNCGIRQIIVEAITSTDEVELILRAAQEGEDKAPKLDCLWLGVVGNSASPSAAMADGSEWHQLRPLLAAALDRGYHRAIGLALHCTHLDSIAAHLDVLGDLLLSMPGLRFGLYPHATQSYGDASIGTPPIVVPARTFAQRLSEIWMQQVGKRPALTGRLDIVGACCQSTPEHIGALREVRDLGGFG